MYHAPYLVLPLLACLLCSCSHSRQAATLPLPGRTSPAIRQLACVLEMERVHPGSGLGRATVDILHEDVVAVLENCGTGTEEAAACMETALVRAVGRAMQADCVAVLPKTSRTWDFLLVVRKMIEPEEPEYPFQSMAGDGVIEGPGFIAVFAAGTGELVQRIDMDNLYVEQDHTGRPTVGYAQVYGERNSVLVVDDYNFDGFEDLAVRNGNFGSYWGPSYTVFLFDPDSGRFAVNEELSALASENLGLFDVDRKRKHLVTFNKSGCCWHITSFYTVWGTRPSLVREVTEDGVSRPGLMVTTDRTLVNGTWIHSETVEPLDNED